MKNIESYIKEINVLTTMLSYGDAIYKCYDQQGYTFFLVYVEDNYEIPIFTFKYNDDNFIYMHVKSYSKNEKHWNPKHTELNEEKVIEMIYKFFGEENENAKTI